MFDIQIIRRKERSYIVSLTDKGLMWLAENLEHFDMAVQVSVPLELTDEFVQNLKDAGLSVEG